MKKEFRNYAEGLTADAQREKYVKRARRIAMVGTEVVGNALIAAGLPEEFPFFAGAIALAGPIFGLLFDGSTLGAEEAFTYVAARIAGKVAEKVAGVIYDKKHPARPSRNASPPPFPQNQR